MTRQFNAIALCIATAFCLTREEALAQATPTIINGSASSITQTPINEGERALDLGDYPRAETLFQDDLKRAAKNAPDRGYLEIGLSEALLNQGRFAEASKEYKKAQSLVENQKAPDELTARLYDGLSWLNQAQGKLDDAIAYAQKAVKTRNSAPDPSQQLMVSTLTHLGNMMELKGQLGEANEFYIKALASQDDLAGPGSLTAADLQENIGSIQRRHGDVQNAKKYFQAALQTKLARTATLAPYAPHAYWETVTFPFVEGSPNCMRKFDQGSQQLIITANGVTVAATLQNLDSTKATQVNVIVHNDSGSQIQFLPIPPSLTMTQPKIMMAPQVDPSKLATTIQKKGDRKAAWIRFWGAQATQTLTSTCIGQPGFFGYPPVYGGYGGGSYNNWGNRGSNMSIMTQQIPDYAAQARALQRAADISGQAHQRSDTIKTTGLGPTAIPPGQTISGALYFDAPKMTESVVRIPIGNATFEFIFPPK